MNPEDEKQPRGFVKEQIRATKGKNPVPLSRAKRKAKTQALIKQVTRLLDLLGPYKEAAVQALIDGLKATRRIYHQGVCVDEVPDELARHKNAVAILEWLEGKPRELQIHVGGNFEDLASLQDRIEKTPAFARIVESSQKAVQGKEMAPALEESRREETQLNCGITHGA